MTESSGDPSRRGVDLDDEPLALLRGEPDACGPRPAVAGCRRPSRARGRSAARPTAVDRDRRELADRHLGRAERRSPPAAGSGTGSFDPSAASAGGVDRHGRAVGRG